MVLIPCGAANLSKLCRLAKVKVHMGYLLFKLLTYN